MEFSESQAAQRPRSALPVPTSNGGAGLTEWSDSQQNARLQTGIPPPPGSKTGSKRDAPQPTQYPDPKRKHSVHQSTTYSSKTLKASQIRPDVRGSSMVEMVKGLPNSALSGSAKPSGMTRAAPADRSTNATFRASSRPIHGRSKSQAPRPQTAYGHRDTEPRGDTVASTGMAPPDQLRTRPSLDQIHVSKVRETKKLQNMVNTTLTQRKGEDEALELAKSRVSELEDYRKRLGDRNEQLKDELDAAREEKRQLQHDMEKQRWEHERAVNDIERSHRETVDDLSRQHRTAVDDLTRELDQMKDQETKEHQQRMDALTRHYQQELEDERQKREREVQEVRTRMSNEYHDMDMALQRKDRDVQEIRADADNVRAELDREKSLRSSLQLNISELSASNTTLEAKINSLKSHVEFLESDSKAQSDSFSSMEARLQEALRVADEARQKLIKEETERRVLFNKYQELKGNIRVMCRVRPALDKGEGDEAGISFPDEKTSAEIILAGPEEKSSLGAVSRKNYPFEFDRVFTPDKQNEEIFDEISQLVQSALDGYNVCIFCYGQTGSGKTYTMSSDDGMIPRATHMIYDTMTKLKEKSWEYTMEGSFVEVYNEDLHDLLTPSDRNSSDGKAKKLEIRHDEARKQTTIVNCKSVQLNSAASVEKILREAQSNRSVAATKANERSSRSHSVFILKLVGENLATGERCEGTLNLVDLAGSERLKHSQAEGDRMKETQNINKSLSCLGDVIEALGRGTGHVPYRNSKLTHLLQYSLGGNSKTLMFVMVSPLEMHLKETLTSLRFATKVHNTHIGTAKATKKIKTADS
ncbi:kinesin motor domain-containingprotein [Purpureocillium lavendulum]|uniref:Kinesin-like protein n=1 Tax=Purpureocillium lavendulum TaxID=1247861 RepID=A0AB34FF45_9HYPO|nr:kinesin motor domain-containingprotein [Purpureocillium lavendulum]